MFQFVVVEIVVHQVFLIPQQRFVSSSSSVSFVDWQLHLKSLELVEMMTLLIVMPKKMMMEFVVVAVVAFLNDVPDMFSLHLHML
jgi:hypothetical protein